MANIANVSTEAVLRCCANILEATANFKGKNLTRSSFLMELATFSLQISLRGTLVQLFLLEFCKSFLDSFLTHHLQTTTSEIHQKERILSLKVTNLLPLVQVLYNHFLNSLILFFKYNKVLTNPLHSTDSISFPK